MCIGRLDADDEALPERVRLGVGEEGSEEHVAEDSEDFCDGDCEFEGTSESGDDDSEDVGGAAPEGACTGCVITEVCGELLLAGERLASLLGSART